MIPLVGEQEFEPSAELNFESQVDIDTISLIKCRRDYLPLL